jgi:arylformamidase
MRIVDLTIEMENGMPKFPAPWQPDVRIEPTATHDKEARSVMKISFSTHSGTHIDAPFHFIEEGKTIDEIDLSKFIRKALVINLSKSESDRAIDVKDLETFETQIIHADGLIFNTGWCKKWGTDEYFLNSPYFTVEAAKWLIERQVDFLGIDFPTVDDPQSAKPGEKLPVHVILLESEVLIIENLTNLDELRNDEVKVIALPLKLKGDGAPVRVIGVIE